MNHAAIEEYLRFAGEKERDEFRSLVTDPRVDFETRRQSWQLLETFSVFLNGFFYCVAVSDSPRKAKYYQEFYDQARSQKGLDGGEL